MKVYILNNGYLVTDKNLVVACAVVGTLNQPKVENVMLKLPVMMVLIDHPDGKILYDLGCNPRAMEEGYWGPGIQQLYPYYFTEEQTIEEQLKLCGTKPEDIKTIVISHLHIDHMGNIDKFPHAEVYVPKADYLAALTAVHANPNIVTHGGYVKAEVTFPCKQYHLVEEDFELVPGIEVVNLPGHTAGLLGLVIHAEKDGTLIFPQDAVYCAENYGPPAQASGLMANNIEFMKSIEKVRKLEKKYNGKVFFAHDEVAFETFRHAPEYYE